MKKTPFCILLMIASSGCAIQPEDSSIAVEDTGSVAQAVYEQPWKPSFPIASQILGMAINGSTTYLWAKQATIGTNTYNNVVCWGTTSSSEPGWRNPCANWDIFSIGGLNVNDIVGIGIAKNTGRVYTYVKTSTNQGRVYQGTKDNLLYYNGGTYNSLGVLPFNPSNPPANPSTPLPRFVMSNLIEVDNSDNGEWYYYWKGLNGTVWRTTGTSVSPYSASGAASVVTPMIFPGQAPIEQQIVGIAFGTGSPAKVYTFYYNQTGPNQPINTSSNSANLNNPEQ